MNSPQNPILAHNQQRVYQKKAFQNGAYWKNLPNFLSFLAKKLNFPLSQIKTRNL
jgi:hypothetical protein